MPGPAAFLAALVLAIVTPPTVHAQASPPAIIVIDQERLFQESALGQSITGELEQRSATLAAENRAIEAELIAEERDLTERRSELPPEEFRALADAFDEKVDRLRSEQDAKTRELVAIRDAGRQSFTQSVGPILLDYMRRTGASVMVDRRSVVATADRVDVTDELIAEIDARTSARDAPERNIARPVPPEDDAAAPESVPPQGGATAREAATPEAGPLTTPAQPEGK
jgi:Skp family chaperone for outer membrane proteins